MKVTMEGRYTTRQGDPVRILCVDNAGTDPVVGIHDGEPYGWKLNGIFRTDGVESTLDLIEVTPPPPTPLEAAARKVVDLHAKPIELRREGDLNFAIAELKEALK